jgi:integrase
LVDYRDKAGVRRFETFKLKKHADARLTTILGELRLGTHTPNSASITMREAAESWYQEGEAGDTRRERATQRNYRHYLDAYILPMLGNHKLSALTTPGIVQFRDRLKDQFKDKTSLVTPRKILLVLKHILSKAQLEGLVGQNVAAPVNYKREQARNKKRLEIGIDIPTKEEVRLMIDTAGGRWRPFLVVLAFCGLRASEIRGLKWDDVDLEKRTITIRQRADRWGTLGMPKSGASQRTIPLGQMVTNVLREWRLKCTKRESNLLFPSAADTPLVHSNIVNLMYRPLQRKAGIVNSEGNPKYELHKLRHFTASHWIDLAFAPKRVQEMMGHSSITMTFDRYGHLFPSLEADQAKLEKGELSILG